MIQLAFRKTVLGAVAFVTAHVNASSESYVPQNSDTAGGLFVRLASLVDAGALAFLDGVLVAAIFTFIGSIMMWVYAKSNNTPRMMALALFCTSILLGSLKGCASMNTQTYLGTSEVEAYRNIEELRNNGYLESNTD
ncbi:MULTISPECIES: hypothetical protein [Vibrio]|uniref:hypothetical protein n=1 Tax=Vibrio TaxID=662 RepID=UPI0004DF1496|nr:hypothetical protein [Vibrio parahaemolyticus]EGQ9239468.1 hypothetical protein [Vibrio vulnificus]EHD1698110.1 hypothetical protein [Vibrio vulnificus]EKZ9225839.1 hypothetical protein [Vibrio vulnificus]ELC9582681.1 hypothetical protein [Vibrio vulnificus]MCU8149782.1 hypothetical protein [Vibrio vulnificus]